MTEEEQRFKNTKMTQELIATVSDAMELEEGVIIEESLTVTAMKEGVDAGVFVAIDEDGNTEIVDYPLELSFVDCIYILSIIEEDMPSGYDFVCVSLICNWVSGGKDQQVVASIPREIVQKVLLKWI